MSAASRATSVPPRPIATPMAACLMAGASLTPSPVIATTSCRPWSSFTMRSLCSGSTRANTRTCASTAPSAASSIDRRSSPVSALASSRHSPSSFAMATAVIGWSPVIITTRMPATRAASIAAFTSARGGSIIPTIPR